MQNEKYANGNGWDEYKKLVLSEISRIADYTKETRDVMDQHYRNTRQEAMNNYTDITTRINDLEIRLLEKINLIDKKVVALQVKAGVWGLVGGAIPVSIGILVWIFQSRLLK